MRFLTPALVLALVAPSATALADDDETALLVDGTWLEPSDGYAASAGMGAELRFVADNEPFTMSIGGFATLGQQGSGGRGRDVFDVHFQAGAKLFGKRARALWPYVGYTVFSTLSYLPMISPCNRIRSSLELRML